MLPGVGKVSWIKAGSAKTNGRETKKNWAEFSNFTLCNVCVVSAFA